jgi:4-amino-4-deoxy-L-arabinose transferase-like glycosyltransferase
MSASVGSALPRRLWWLGALLLLAFWLGGLGLAPLFDVDEGAFSEASREMLTSGDWGHTTLSGTDRFDKPILIYWFQAASLALLGVNEWATRLPSALAGWGWCVALAGFAAPRWGWRVAVLAAGMLATSVGPMLIGRAATADSMLNLLLTLTALDLWRAVEQGEHNEDYNPWPLRRAALWMGLGLLDKGPVAIVVPGGALALWWLLSPLAAQRWPLARRVLADGRAWIIVLLVAGPWYAYALHRHGMTFVDGFFLKHNLDRFSGTLEGHSGSPLYYLVVMPLLFLPWSVLLLPVLVRVRALWPDATSRYLLLWAAFVLGFFSLSGTKLPHYVLYGMAPLVLLCARYWAETERGVYHWGWALALSALALLGLTAAAPDLAARLQAGTRDEFWRSLLGAAAATPAPSVALLGLAAVVVLALYGWALTRPRQGALALLGAVALAAVVWSTLALPWWGQALQGPVRELALRARADHLPLVQWHLHLPSAAFYRQQPAPRRAPEPGEAALMRADHYAALSPDELAHYTRLAQAPGLVLVQRR